MALVFPKTPSTYRAFFKEFADRHIYIANNDKDRKNFSQVSLENAVRGFSDIETKEFFNSLRTSAKIAQEQNEINCGMILIEMDGNSDESVQKQNSRIINASYAIVTKPLGRDNYEAIDTAKDICYQTGFDILSCIKEFFTLNYLQGKIVQIEDECIGKIANDIVGWRFDISYLVMRDAFVRPEMFQGLIIEELPTNTPTLI